MNVKKKIKTFFAMTSKNNRGFTLVELIVVIAILAILAGVGIPAYSGYVKKAEIAKDEQLLAVVNRAFASACAVNGEDHIGRQDVSAKITNGLVTVSVTEMGDAFDTAFTDFYEGGEFKIITKLKYDEENGMFIADDRKLTADNNLLDEFKSSIFNKIDTEDLTSEVDRLANALGGMHGSLKQLVSDNPYFQNVLIASGAFDEYVKDGVLDAEALKNAMDDPSVAKKVANSTVLLVADATKDLDFDDVYAGLQMDGNLTGVLGGKGLTGNDGRIVKVALQYGMMYGFANSGEADQTFRDSFNNATLDSSLEDLYTEMISSTNFYHYMHDNDDITANAQEDLKGFLAALDIINTNVKDGNVDLDDMGQDGFFGNFADDIDELLGK